MAAKIPKASKAVEAARARRPGRRAADDVRWESHVDEAISKIAIPMRKRVALATRHLRAKVVRNLNVSVVRGTGPRGGRVVLERSKPGEFPRKDLTPLVKLIFDEVKETSHNVWDGYVATPLDYGLILETKMNRSFLLRTFNEERGVINKILSGPIA